MQRQNQIKLASVGCLILSFYLLFELTGLRDNFTIEYLRTAIEEHLLVGALIFIAIFTLGNLIQIPGWILLAAAVFALGKIHGGLLTYCAAITSCIVTYFLIRFIGQDALRDFDSKIAKKLFALIDTKPIVSIILLRMVFQTLPVLNYSLALSRIQFRHYLIGTVLGLPLPILVYCLFFDYLSSHLL